MALIYAYNATDIATGARVGVLLDATDLLDAAVFRQTELRWRYPNRRDFVEVGFLPVWVKDVYPIWYRWQCLHSVGRYDLAPFEVVQADRLGRGTRVTLSVPLLRAAYDPYEHTMWLWGCERFDPWNVLMGYFRRGLGQHSHHGTKWEFEAARVRYLLEVGWNDPIEVCTDFVIAGCEIIVEEGNHRFAAAIARGDKTIEAIAIGDMQIIRKYEER